MVLPRLRRVHSHRSLVSAKLSGEHDSFAERAGVSFAMCQNGPLGFRSGDSFDFLDPEF